MDQIVGLTTLIPLVKLPPSNFDSLDGPDRRADYVYPSC